MVKQIHPKIDPETEHRIFYGEWDEDNEEDMAQADIVKQLALWCPFITVEVINPGYDPKWIDQLKENQLEYAD